MIDLQTLGLDAFRQNAGEASRLLKALSNEHRLMILCRLGDEEVQVSRLQEEIGLSQSALSQHLARLRDEGLVASRREGVSIYYRIADPAAVRVIAVLAEIYCPPEN
ncbi:metalloregulator ArsR/SmtB family transcription factor [Brevundimonas sp.]|uniref:ArsR/SmtB family transcription factor n=1 Tax=Brevundimonas sp. TaxID=1871086 RepID=UPI0019A4294A|nr:metalloregulator ArsR/SmtB family transcription factor [Brevundimonas sp.]MBD3835657.1 winged helix-turn-helix transcriptional regulator [Brevundimonas sp.]